MFIDVLFEDTFESLNKNDGCQQKGLISILENIHFNLILSFLSNESYLNLTN